MRATEDVLERTSHHTFSLVQDPEDWRKVKSSTSHFAVVSEDSPTVCAFHRAGRQTLDEFVNRRPGPTDDVSVESDGKM